MRRQAETYGLGYVPVEYGGMTTAEKMRDLQKRVCVHIRDLFGPSWRVYIAHVGLPTSSIPYITGRQRLSPASVHHLRMAQMILLVHLGEIRERVHEVEREIWVEMQMTHDPNITGESAYTSELAHVTRGRQHIREALGNAIKHIPRPYFMPVRALSLLEYPNLTSAEARALRLKEMIDEGEIKETWMSQAVYDGLRDPDLVRPKYATRRTNKRKRTWYAQWRVEERERLGRRPPMRIDSFEPETMESYLKAKQRHENRKLKEELEGGKKVSYKTLPRDVDTYLIEARQKRRAEQLAFLRLMSKHKVPVDQLLENHFDDLAAEATELSKDPLVGTNGRSTYRNVMGQTTHREREREKVSTLKELSPKKRAARARNKRGAGWQRDYLIDQLDQMSSKVRNRALTLDEKKMAEIEREKEAEIEAEMLAQLPPMDMPPPRATEKPKQLAWVRHHYKAERVGDAFIPPEDNSAPAKLKAYREFIEQSQKEQDERDARKAKIGTRKKNKKGTD